jgi:sugar lactone lactonase YvrE
MNKKMLALYFLSVLLSLAFTNKPYGETWSVSTIAGMEIDSKIIDGQGQKAHFTWSTGNCTIDANDNLYVIDKNCLRKVDASGNVTSLYGEGAADENSNDLKLPPLPGKAGICIDKDNNLYVSNETTHTIYKISTNGKSEIFAGQDDISQGNKDGDRLKASFNTPTAICFDKAGNMYVADTYNYSVRKISTDGEITTIASPGKLGIYMKGFSADSKDFKLKEFRAIAVDSKGNVYIPQTHIGTCIVKISPDGEVSIFAGDANVPTYSGTAYDGTGAAARFLGIQTLAMDKDDNLIVGEEARVRKITPAALVTTLAGKEGGYDWADGIGAKARFYSINGISINSKGNILVSDKYCIRKMIQ